MSRSPRTLIIALHSLHFACSKSVIPQEPRTVPLSTTQCAVFLTSFYVSIKLSTAVTSGISGYPRLVTIDTSTSASTDRNISRTAVGPVLVPLLDSTFNYSTCERILCGKCSRYFQLPFIWS